jgi:AcrR family transcriptional regulator
LKKTDVIKTALELFTTKGFHGTPTSMIARDAGAATGTLFHHLKTKNQV